MQNLEAELKTKTPKLSEKEFNLFKKWLKSHLAFGPVTVIFTKKDGTERVMNCTTNKDLIPAEPLHETNTPNPIDFPKKERKINEEIMPVYDLEAGHWKSFRWDSIKQVRFTL